MGNHESLIQQYPDGVYSGFCKKQETAEANNAEAPEDNTAARKKEKEQKVIE